jgi:hypothetical protein
MRQSDPAVRPQMPEYAESYHGYVSAAPDGDVRVTLEREGERALSFYRGVSAAQAGFSYAPGKWTVREVLAHVTDAERVFSYRALRFGRGDATPLAGFDQEVWTPASHANERAWEDLLGEFHVVRAATLHLVRTFAAEDWARLGVASGYPVSVRALAWIVAGHELHHRRVLVERYGLRPPGA